MFIMFIKYKTNMKIYWYSEYKIRNKFIIESKYKFSFLEKHVFFFKNSFLLLNQCKSFDEFLVNMCEFLYYIIEIGSLLYLNI